MFSDIHTLEPMTQNSRLPVGLSSTFYDLYLLFLYKGRLKYRILN